MLKKLRDNKYMLSLNLFMVCVSLKQNIEDYYIVIKIVFNLKKAS